MPTRLPDVLHLPPDHEGPVHHVSMVDQGVGEAIPRTVSDLLVTKRTPVAFERINPHGLGNVFNAYRMLKYNGQKPTEEAIAALLNGMSTDIEDLIAGIDNAPRIDQSAARMITVTLENGADPTESAFLRDFGQLVFGGHHEGVMFSDVQQPTLVLDRYPPHKRDRPPEPDHLDALHMVRSYFHAHVDLGRGPQFESQTPPLAA